MADPRNSLVPPTSMLLDGCIYWPTSNNGIIRIDPFHIKAFGIVPAKNHDQQPGFVVWVDTGGPNNYNAWHDKRESAESEFRRLQTAKAMH